MQGALANRQDASQSGLGLKFKRLEKTSQPCKRMQWNMLSRRTRGMDCSYHFKQKGHQEQIEFNEGVEDRVNVAAKRMKRLALSEG